MLPSIHLTRRLSENGYFPQSLRQAQIIILEILNVWMPVPLYLSGAVIIFAFLDLGKNISFSDSLLAKPRPQTDQFMVVEYLYRS